MQHNFVKIKAIQLKGVEETYDICVDFDGHYYIGNNIVLKNSMPNLQQIPSRKDKLGIRERFVANVKIPKWFKDKHPGDLL